MTGLLMVTMASAALGASTPSASGATQATPLVGTNWVLTAGFEGTVRVFETAKGSLVRAFQPVPIKREALHQQAAR